MQGMPATPARLARHPRPSSQPGRRLGPPMPPWGYQPFAQLANVGWNGQSDLLSARNVLWCGHCIGSMDGWCAGGVIGRGASLGTFRSRLGHRGRLGTGAAIRRCRPGVTSRSPNRRMSAGTDNPTCSVPGVSSGADTASAQRTAGRPEAASDPPVRGMNPGEHERRLRRAVLDYPRPAADPVGSWTDIRGPTRRAAIARFELAES